MEVTKRLGMMMAATVALGLAVGVNTAMAAERVGGYVALSHFAWEVESGGGGPALESSTLRAVGGYMINDRFGVEGHVATGGTDDFIFNGEAAEAELNKLVGIFAKGNLPLLDGRINLFGLAGYAHGRVDVLAVTTAEEDSQNSFAWGAGADVALMMNRLYFTADHMNYIDKSGIEATATSLGLRWQW